MKVFNIPIYRTTIEQFDTEFKNDKLRKEDCEQILWNYVDRMNYIKELNWYPWEFNEIIGYIRLSCTLTEIEGTLFLMNYKRIIRNFIPRKIRYQKTLFHLDYSIFTDNSSFTEILRKEIIDVAKNESSIKRRHVDLLTFENFAKYYDWGKLIQDNRSDSKISSIELLNQIANSPNSRLIYFGEEMNSGKSYYDKNTDIDDLLRKAKEKENEKETELTESTKSFLKELAEKSPDKFLELILILKNERNANTQYSKKR